MVHARLDTPGQEDAASCPCEVSKFFLRAGSGFS